MSNESVTLRLGGTVTVKDFAETAEDFARLLRVLAEEVGQGRHVTWLISGLDYGSAAVTATAVADTPSAEESLPTLVGSFLSIARDVRDGRGDGRRASPIVRRIASRATEEALVTFETSEADVIFFAPLEDGSAPSLEPTTAFGTVRGRIQTLSERRGLRFTLYDLLNDKAVSCYIDEGKEELLRNAWGHIADVAGVVTRDPRSDRPISIRHVSAVDLVPEVPATSFLRARGAVVAADDAPPSDEIVRSIRNEW